MMWHGLLALAGFAIHAGYQVWHGRPEDLLWACHIAAAIVGVGLLVGSAATNAVGVLLLIVGVPLWLLELSMGASSIPLPCLLTSAAWRSD
jgi:hypothetical protein